MLPVSCEKFRLNLLNFVDWDLPFQNILLKRFLFQRSSLADYAKSVWGQTSVTNLKKKYQRMQNYAARIIINNFDYINVRSADLVYELHWMTVKDRCLYFTCIVTFKCLHNLAPNYIYMWWFYSELWHLLTLYLAKFPRTPIY